MIAQRRRVPLPTLTSRTPGGNTDRGCRQAGLPGTYRLQKGLRALDQFIQPWLIGVARLAGVDDRYLAVLGRHHQLRVSTGVDVADVSLLVSIVEEHLAVELDALVTGRAARGLDLGFVR